MEIRQTVGKIGRRLFGPDIFKRLRGQIQNIRRRVRAQPISADDLRNALLAMGQWQGNIVWVQSSWDEFYNVRMKPSEVIDLMLELVGPDGTLVMPAFPLRMDPGKILNIDREPAGTGLLPELLRRYPGARRSIHLRSSVVAVGKHADEITEGHELTDYPWGPGSPYDKIRRMHGLMISLGFVRLGFTPLHYASCVLHGEIPMYDKIFRGTTTYSWKKADGRSGTHTYINRHGEIRPERLVRHFVPGLYRERRVSNLLVMGMPAYEGIERLIALARQGKTFYILPK